MDYAKFEHCIQHCLSDSKMKCSVKTSVDLLAEATHPTLNLDISYRATVLGHGSTCQQLFNILKCQFGGLERTGHVLQGVYFISKPEEAGRLAQLIQTAATSNLFAFDFHLAERMRRNPFQLPMPGTAGSSLKPSMFIHSVGIAVGRELWRVQMIKEFAQDLAGLFNLQTMKVNVACYQCHAYLQIQSSARRKGQTCYELAPVLKVTHLLISVAKCNEEEIIKEDTRP